MKKYLILVLAVLATSCQEKGENTINSVKVWYYNGIFETPLSLTCDEIVYLPEKVDTLNVLGEDGDYVPKHAVILESIITDKEVLREIAIELHKRKVIKENYEDARMKCFIFFNNGQTDSLCMDHMSTCGNYNGQSVQLSNKLLYLIRQNCGFYRWIGVSEFPYFDELNDTTFTREKVKSRWGGEY